MIKIRFKNESQLFVMCLLLHQLFNFLQLLLKIKTNISLHEPTVDERLPVLHVIQFENDSFELHNDCT